MLEHPIIDIIQESGVVAIIRRSGPFDAPAIAQALVEGGVRVLEITLNSHNALEAIKAVRAEAIPGLIVGAGTVRRVADAHAAIAAGAEFLVSPNFDRPTVEVAHAAGLPMLPGVATPSEAVAAFEAGCGLLKLFPAAALGANYLKLIRDPLDDVKFMATGGVDANNLHEFFKAGAVAVGLGSSLVGKGDEPVRLVTGRAVEVIGAIARVRRG
jgi:2-dehydro-3-deoxyphosphogluconate aldolase / (4S)-4-hydroxy-2-oxoglutarate aldolase